MKLKENKVKDEGKVRTERKEGENEEREGEARRESEGKEGKMRDGGKVKAESEEGK